MCNMVLTVYYSLPSHHHRLLLSFTIVFQVCVFQKIGLVTPGVLLLAGFRNFYINMIAVPAREE